jgi:peptidoglycan lytic transglycosylase G
VEERPPRITRHRSSSSATRILAVIGGLILGVGVLAAIAFAVVGRGNGNSAAASTPATTGPPPKPVLRIIFPEGFTIAQMAERISAVNKIAKEKRHVTSNLSPRSYLLLGKSKTPPPGFPYKKRVPNLEGFLFPATYDFNEDTTTKQLFDEQLEAFMRAWSQLDLRYAKKKNLTAYDVLIIASMVEKEVVVPKERPLVAAVIYNRLHVGMSLGIDATLRYGLHIPPTEPIRESQIQSDSPYNTRNPNNLGLTPTPIANPGLASLQAAAHPAKVDYLYFVRKPDCKSHFFTASEQEFRDYPRGGLRC